MLKICPILIWGGISLGTFVTTVAQVVEIRQLHYNDSQGQPAAPYSIGSEVTIQGLVTVGSGTLAIDHTEVYVQDATGGILIYSDQISTQFSLGDSVTITGTISQHRGMTALRPIQVTIRSQGQALPEPPILTCSQVAQAFGSDYTEPHEARLIRLNNVTSRQTYPNLTLLDGTGACQMFLHPNTGIPKPSGSFSVIGILIQDDPSLPYTDNYRIMPRFSSDIIAASPPNFLSLPVETEIEPYQVTLRWQTDFTSTSLLKYGRTEDYELGIIEDANLVTDHAVTVPNLRPATIYHCQAISSNAYGSASSPDHIFITASRPESTGEINVYFNQSVDTSLASTRKASGRVKLLDRLLYRINRANYSIDVCCYWLTLNEVAQSLIRAHQRGVKIRFIFDQDHYESQIASLRANGLPVIDDAFGNNDSEGKYNHNKFVIFDHRDTTSAADDWVWMGSNNFTYNGVFRNAENVVEIQDEALAECYTIEFNEMWGSDGDSPDSMRSRFGVRKRDNTPHIFNINGIELRQYMSPSDGCASQVMEAIQTAQSSLYFCIFSFTHSALAQTMWAQRQEFPELRIKGVFDSDNQDDSYSQWYNLSGSGSSPWNPPADVWLDKEFTSGTYLHHKYMIIDGNRPDSDPMVITGSYNWSYSADEKNDENLLIIKDATIANLYLQEFAERYHRSGGHDTLVARVTHPALGVPNHFLLEQNYPNPFNSLTRISYRIPQGRSRISLGIYNVLGQSVRTLVDKEQIAGSYEVTWDGKDEKGNEVSSGVYLYRLKVGQVVQTKKMVLLP